MMKINEYPITPRRAARELLGILFAFASFTVAVIILEHLKVL
jgi:hypothetical protein